MFLNVDNVGAERMSSGMFQVHKMPGCRVVALFWARPNHHEQRNVEQKG